MAPWCSGQRPGRNDIPVLREKGSAMVHVDGKDSKKKRRDWSSIPPQGGLAKITLYGARSFNWCLRMSKQSPSNQVI